MFIRYFIIFLSIVLYYSAPGVSASESKSESTSPAQHTPHPHHDHPDNDHIKKLDEGLRKSRKKEQEESEIGSTLV